MPDGKPNPIDIHVGKRIKLRRLALGVSQETLAERLGVTCMQSPRMRNYTPEKIAELAAGQPLVVANDIMHDSENLLLVSSYNRIPNRQLAKYLFAVMVNLERCTSLSVENDVTEKNRGIKKVNKTANCGERHFNRGQIRQPACCKA